MCETSVTMLHRELTIHQHSLLDTFQDWHSVSQVAACQRTLLRSNVARGSCSAVSRRREGRSPPFAAPASCPLHFHAERLPASQVWLHMQHLRFVRKAYGDVLWAEHGPL